jgi:4-hydroxy-3-polyprenylbenzoate decarboxylase
MGVRDMAYYKDLREHLKALEDQGKLIRVIREINKDTQLHPLMRLQFRGLPEEERKGWLFENVSDSRGRKYSTPVACCNLAASRQVYAIGLMCKPEEINEKMAQAESRPIAPKLVDWGPVHEEIHVGDGLLEHGGLDEFPIPISTPGFDIAPYLAAPCWVTKDPETGLCNVGTYRTQVKSPTRTGLYFASADKHVAMHWRKWKERGQPMPAAIVNGTSPNIGYVSSSRFGYGVDEYAVAGGIAGEPVELVKCKTVDLEVPAYAEIVFEGEVSTDEVEPEGPFGEYGGYMSVRRIAPYFTIRCITHRKGAIWQNFLSQFAPSEGMVVWGIAQESEIYKYLRYETGIPDVIDVGLVPSGSGNVIVIRLKRSVASKAWAVLDAMAARLGSNKIFITVDEDINPRDMDAVNWAIAFSVQPHRDIKIVRDSPATIEAALDPSLEPLTETIKRVPPYLDIPQPSVLLIDATRKWDYTPVSLPSKELMEEAVKLWQQEGLPPLRLHEPWWGYDLGFWTEEEQEEAKMAIQGRYYATGEKQAQRRSKV